MNSVLPRSQVIVSIEEKIIHFFEITKESWSKMPPPAEINPALIVDFVNSVHSSVFSVVNRLEEAGKNAFRPKELSYHLRIEGQELIDIIIFQPRVYYLTKRDKNGQEKNEIVSEKKASIIVILPNPAKKEIEENFRQKFDEIIIEFEQKEDNNSFSLTPSLRELIIELVQNTLTDIQNQAAPKTKNEEEKEIIEIVSVISDTSGYPLTGYVLDSINIDEINIKKLESPVLLSSLTTAITVTLNELREMLEYAGIIPKTDKNELFSISATFSSSIYFSYIIFNPLLESPEENKTKNAITNKLGALFFALKKNPDSNVNYFSTSLREFLPKLRAVKGDLGILTLPVEEEERFLEFLKSLLMEPIKIETIPLLDLLEFVKNLLNHRLENNK